MGWNRARWVVGGCEWVSAIRIVRSALLMGYSRVIYARTFRMARQQYLEAVLTRRSTGLVSILTATNRKELGVGLREGRSRSRSRGRICGLGIGRSGLTSLALRSGWVSGSRRVVVIVYGPTAGLAGHVTTRIRGTDGRRRGIAVSLLRDLRLAGLFHDVVTVFVGEIFGLLASQGLVFLEGG